MPATGLNHLAVAAPVEGDEMRWREGAPADKRTLLLRILSPLSNPHTSLPYYPDSAMVSAIFPEFPKAREISVLPVSD